MASKHNKQLADKVQEIKRMQANWMRQRETTSEETKVKGQGTTGAGHQSRQRKKTNEASKKKQETMTWVTSGDGSSKKKNLRIRSASPAGRQKENPKIQPGRQTRPLSGNNNSRSRPGGERDRGLLSKPPVAKGSSSDRSVSSNKSMTNGKLGSRTDSEPNLFAKESKIANDLRTTCKYDDDSKCNASIPGLDASIPGLDASIPGLEKVLGDNQSDEDASDNGNRLEASKPEEDDKSETRTSGANLLEPDAFDRLADQIATRVKAEMRLERTEVRQSAGLPLKSILNEETDSILSSHHCIKCKQKMIPPDYPPTVLIPCGHTFCEPCAEDRIKCPTCRTKVTSTAENSTLLQIIMGSTPNKRKHSTNKQTSHPTNHNSLPHSNHSYHPRNYTNNHDDDALPSEEQTALESGSEHQRTSTFYHKTKVERSGVRKRTMDPKVRADNYASEYESLSIRCEAMGEEEQTIMEVVEKTNREIMQQKKTIGNISKQQDRLSEEIQQLQDKIALLDDHRTEYERKCEELEEDKTEKISQLHMVRQMMRQLEGDKDKVRMQAQDLGIYLK